MVDIMFYTGIGYRKTPKDIQEFFTWLSGKLEKRGYTLRSGGADGADVAFEEGVIKNKEIYLPWKKFNENDSELYKVCSRAMGIASEFHQGWRYLPTTVKKLHGRNVYQVLGKSLDIPSKFVICWTPDGAEK